MPLQITDEQLAEAHEWELRLMKNECTLEEAMSVIMGIGAPMPDYVRQRFELAFIEYRGGFIKNRGQTPESIAKNYQVRDLAEWFGHPTTLKQVKAIRTWIRDVRIHEAVKQAAKDGHGPKTDPRSYDETASHYVAKQFNLSPATVFDIYRKGRGARESEIVVTVEPFKRGS